MDFDIVDIRDAPEHAGAVAGWVYREWWSRSSTPLGVVERWVQGCASGDGFPGALVAVAAGRAFGSVFIHRTEAEDRPEFTPYLGALYVDPAFRRNAVGPALVRAACAHAARLGFRELYLNAATSRTPFYEALGWSVVEERYGPDRLTIMCRVLDAG